MKKKQKIKAKKCFHAPPRLARFFADPTNVANGIVIFIISFLN
jgi:uncharacterized membrane protein